MDLEAFARANGLAVCVDEVRSWHGELAATDKGQAVLRNLRGDTQLETTARGRAALTRLVRRVNSRATDSPSVGFPWLEQVHRDRTGRFLSQGRTVRIHAATDLLARTTELNTVLEHLVRKGQITSADPTVRRRWATRFLVNPAVARTVIETGAMVRGALPLVFACPDVDRQSAMPPGTLVSDINAVLGLRSPTDPDPPVDLCVFRFRRSTTPCPGHVPTGLDAYTHPYYLPVPSGSPWGFTHDLRSPISAPQYGVRECVLDEFPAQHIEDYAVVEA